MLAFLGLASLAWQSGQGQSHHLPEPTFGLYGVGILAGVYLMVAPLTHLPPFRRASSSSTPLEVEVDSYILEDQGDSYVTVGLRNGGEAAEFQVRLTGYHRSLPTSHDVEFTPLSMPWRDNEAEKLCILHSDERLLLLARIETRHDSFAVFANCMDPGENVGTLLAREVQFQEEIWLICALYRVEPDASEGLNVHVQIPVSESGVHGKPLTWVIRPQSRPHLRRP